MKKQIIAAIIVISTLVGVSCKKEKTTTPTPDLFSTTPMTASGEDFTLILNSNGNLYGVGDNSSGQLASTDVEINCPRLIRGHVKAIAAGGYHSLFITQGDSLFAVGENGKGQLGDGTTTGRNIPVFVMNNVKTVYAGTYHSFALTNDGQLLAIGENTTGYFGNGTTTTSYVWTLVATNVKDVKAGVVHTVILKNDGTVWTAGDNSYWQVRPLEDGVAQVNTFEQIATDAKAIDAGSYHTLILKNNNELWGRGRNQFGEFGLGHTIAKSIDRKIADNIKAFAGGNGNSFYITQNDSLYASGYNRYGQLGLGNSDNINTFQFVKTNANYIYANKMPNNASAFYVDKNNRIYATGLNTFSRLGICTPDNVSIFTAIVFP